MKGIQVFKSTRSLEEGRMIESVPTFQPASAGLIAKERQEDAEFYAKVRQVAISHAQIFANAAEMQDKTTTQRDSFRKLW